MKRLLLTVALLFVVAVASAQVTTATIRGSVTANDNPLPGATIVALHTPSGTNYGTTANGEGYYSISGMRVGGPYEITITFIGYKTLVIKDVHLSLGGADTFDAALVESPIEVDDIVVMAGGKRTTDGSTFSRVEIETIPSIDRAIFDLTHLMSSAVSPASGGIVLSGQSPRYNAFSIDGTSSEDIYGLGTTGMTGSLTRANPIPIDALEAVSLSTSTVDVRESGFTGGAINAITRSGSNEFRGSAYTYFNNQEFWGTTPGKNIAERKPLSQQMTNIVGVTIGGPIIKDKLFFFAAGEFNRNMTPSTNYPGSAVSALTLEEAERISKHYEGLTGYDGGGYGENDVLELTGSAVARLDWNISTNHHLSLRYNMLHADADAVSNSAQAFYFTGAEYTNINRTHSVVAELNSAWTDSSDNHVSNSLRVGYTRLQDGRTTEESLPAVIINGLGERGTGSATIGTNPYSGRNMLYQDVFIIGDDVTFSRGKHDITVGTTNEIYRADNLYMANARGTYTYASMDDFLADRATQYAYGYFATGKKNPPMTTGQFAIYAQDEVALSRELRLTYGLRLDIPVMFDTPGRNEEFNSSYFAKFGTMTGDIPRAQILLSPRIGVEWKRDIVTLRGSAGIYTGSIPFVWLSNCYQNNGLRSIGVTVTNPDETPSFSLNPESVGIPSNPSIDLVSKDFRYPQVFRITAGAKVDLYPLVVSVDADYTKGINNIFVENLVAEDHGQRLYVGGDSSNTSATYYNSTTKDYAAVYRLRNTSKGYSWSTTARVEYSFLGSLEGLKAMAAYTYSMSRSVNDGVSAQSSSNWGRTYAVDSNSPELSSSIYEFPHKVVASLSYSRRYGLFGTNVMLLYNGYSGEHYSLTYVRGKVDANGDTYRGNSLIYIPTEAEMSSMLWADDTSSAAFNDYIKADKYLSAHRGKFAERNSHSLPFVHRLDLHVAQSFYFSKQSSRRIELSLDVINLSNLISRSWGLVHRTSNWALSPVTITELKEVDGGYRPVYKFNGAEYTTNDIASRWHMQLGLKIVF
ncbi:MAG: TonB-dependent receptor [Alistipes sp.]|nr:TonB-dependent receptor [Alistipes sp.]